MNYNLILKDIKKLRKKENEIQDAMDSFCKVLAPNEYAPIIEQGLVQAYIDGVSNGNAELKDWLEYYAYEIPLGKSPMTVTGNDGTKYDFKKDKDVVAFLENNFN
jgi:hypothetical protein